MQKSLGLALALALLPGLVRAQTAAPAAPRRDQVAFRALYKELVETNTSSRPAAAPWPPSAWRRT